MKDITLKITGKQCQKDQDEEQVEFITDGKLYEKDGAYYVVYEETELSGMEGAKTTLKLKDNTVKMKRIGQEGPGTELYFESGRRFSSAYETPYGSLDVEVLTKNIANGFDSEKLNGKIEIEYDISLGGLSESRNRLIIDLM